MVLSTASRRERSQCKNGGICEAAERESTEDGSIFSEDGRIHPKMEAFKDSLDEVTQKAENSAKQLQEVEQKVEASKRQLDEVEKKVDASEKSLSEAQERMGASVRVLQEMEQKLESSTNQLSLVEHRVESSVKQLFQLEKAKLSRMDEVQKAQEQMERWMKQSVCDLEKISMDIANGITKLKKEIGSRGEEHPIQSPSMEPKFGPGKNDDPVMEQVRQGHVLGGDFETFQQNESNMQVTVDRQQSDAYKLKEIVVMRSMMELEEGKDQPSETHSSHH